MKEMFSNADILALNLYFLQFRTYTFCLPAYFEARHTRIIMPFESKCERLESASRADEKLLDKNARKLVFRRSRSSSESFASRCRHSRGTRGHAALRHSYLCSAREENLVRAEDMSLCILIYASLFPTLLEQINGKRCYVSFPVAFRVPRVKSNLSAIEYMFARSFAVSERVAICIRKSVSALRASCPRKPLRFMRSSRRASDEDTLLPRLLRISRIIFMLLALAHNWNKRPCRFLRFRKLRVILNALIRRDDATPTIRLTYL